MSDAVDDRERELIERYGLAGLRAIATRALANGDDYSRALLRAIRARGMGRPHPAHGPGGLREGRARASGVDAQPFPAIPPFVNCPQSR